MLNTGQGLSEECSELGSSPHSHLRGQLYYCVAGAFNAQVQSQSWLVVPQRALWIPSGLVHQSKSEQSVSLRILYICTERYRDLPSTVRVVQVSPLLRELIAAAIQQGDSWLDKSPESRVASVLVDQIVSSFTEQLCLPLPLDSRALAVCTYLQDNPSLHVDIDAVCRNYGISQRTLVRVLKRESGTSLQQWRQQLLLLKSIEMISKRKSVTYIATELGYATPSAFSSMFRRAIGVSPLEYRESL